MRSESELFASLDGDGDSVPRQHLDLDTEFSGFGDGLSMQVHETVIILATTYRWARQRKSTHLCGIRTGWIEHGQQPKYLPFASVLLTCDTKGPKSTVCEFLRLLLVQILKFL